MVVIQIILVMTRLTWYLARKQYDFNRTPVLRIGKLEISNICSLDQNAEIRTYKN